MCHLHGVVNMLLVSIHVDVDTVDNTRALDRAFDLDLAGEDGAHVLIVAEEDLLDGRTIGTVVSTKSNAGLSEGALVLDKLASFITVVEPMGPDRGQTGELRVANATNETFQHAIRVLG